MAKFIDYYKILGVSKDIPQSEIKAAYRKRSKQFHPDLHPEDPKAKAKFQMLNEAYEVLSDPDKRARYDQYGEQWDKVGGAGANGGGNPFGGGFNPFGGGFNSNGGQGGGNPFGDFEFNFDSGGFSDFFSELFTGKRGGKAGRNNDGSAQREPKAAQASITIDMYQALLGDEIIITVGDEKLRLKIKPGTQPGTKVRMRGKGHPKADGSRGDLILTLNVSLPANLTERQKELLRQMQSAR